ncbi:MAG: 2-hydroxyglutaryl-CoA dehydratase [Myxococcales bacterium]|nr:2-hydroxyglutaryl-CoA dehydratase [Myxococcales bacterium]
MNAPTTDPRVTLKKSLPLAAVNTRTDGLTDDELRKNLAAYEAGERARLGIRDERRQWIDTMVNPDMKREERERVTLLISGLTKAQDFLVEGAISGQGYKVKNIGCPDNEGLQHGKEYGNRGQCNPTYFTVGNLVKYLCELRDKRGLTAKQVVDNYVFFTAGACGPCRFGMYVTEYRKALRDAGFEGFRVMLFQQQGGLSQATGDDVGIDLSPKFFLAIVQAVVAGDVINALGYRMRPYELEAGATNRASEEAKKICYRALFEKKNIFKALYRSRKLFGSVKVDKLKAKPKVSIIGEFWAMTTEGDGNYQLQTFLEGEGAECDIQLTTAWLLYNIWEVARDTRQRDGLRHADDAKSGLHEHQGELDIAKRQASLKLAEWGLRIGFQAFALPPGLHGYHLPDMDQIAEVADGHYSNDLRGGEGHMEVGKLITNVVGKKAHMTLSVKPFGCMPSSGVSDGVQSLITTKYPGTIFCAVETSGDGATNFYSRCQMFLYKARIAAEEELARTFAEHGLTRAEVEAFLAKNPKYASPLHKSPHVACGTAADLVHEVAPLIKLSRAARTRIAVKKAANAQIARVLTLPGKARRLGASLADPEVRAAIALDLEVLQDLVSGKARELYGPIVKRLTTRAYFGSDAESAAVTHDHGMHEAEPLAAE